MRLSTRLKIIFPLVLVLIFFVFFNFTDSYKPIKNFFYLISEQIQKGFWQIGGDFSNFLSTPFEIKVLKEKNETLYSRNQELLSEISFLKELKKENETLRDALNIGLEKEFQLMLCQVVSKDISRDSLLIDKGKNDGVSKGLPVITNQKMILGRIGEVYDNFSEVILISNKESSFDAKVSEKDIYGVVKGKGKLEIYLDLIPKDKEISEGDFVITSALGGIFPPAILVGEIKKVTKSDLEIWQTAEIQPAFDLNKIESLFIITQW